MPINYQNEKINILEIIGKKWVNKFTIEKNDQKIIQITTKIKRVNH